MIHSRVAGKLPAALATLALVASLGIAGTAPASAACGTTWGSLPKAGSASSSAQVANVRTGRHDCFDRMVVDLDGKAPSYSVKYAPLHGIGSGHPIPLRGNADLRLIMDAPSYDREGQPTYPIIDRSELANVAGYQTFRQLAWAGSYEGQTLIGLGVRARLPFRTFVLDVPGGGSRLVVDVAHFWS
ncbi:hypothetical protein [Arthrobacter sp. Br18]|uniref:AMIN-like domain-containing (lipo)protein n=1 Tax=Arthrobacter sp. Br18 TaxID=1312954 RepID=UPI0004B2D2A1|nr:hypothetical protein [Arthrobacter sp. Br18]